MSPTLHRRRPRRALGAALVGLTITLAATLVPGTLRELADPA
ncbi:hypothetical protein [Streptomyces sp. YGL11-2]